jgi:hypothetical protein
VFANFGEDMARRESMIFYASWWASIKELPVVVRNEVLNTVVEYGIEGVMTSEQGQMTKAIMALIKPQIDANNQKYENGCKGGEYGALGGRPKKPQENPNETPGKPQENPNETPTKPLMIYDNDNDNVNVNDNESESDARTPTLTREEEKFYQFLEWCRHYAPDSLRFREPLTIHGFLWLYAKYGAQKMKDCASDLHSKEAYKRNKNALNCWKKWIQNL